MRLRAVITLAASVACRSSDATPTASEPSFAERAQEREAVARREQFERIARTQFKATRAPAGDADCKASGKPPIAYIFGGSTHADNVAASATLGCEPLGRSDRSTTPFVCCSRSDLPAVPTIQLP